MPEIADLPLTSPQVGDGFIVRRGTSPALVELPDFSGGSAPHTHPIADVVGLQTALDGKQASGSYASSVHTHVISDTTGLQAALDGKASALGVDDNYVTDAEKTKLSLLSGTNTGDQTSIVGVSGTKAQFNTAVTDGDFLYVGDAPTAHTHLLAAGATDVTITATNLNILDDGVDTTLHFHAADRARAVHTGTQLASTISDFSTAVAATASVTANTAKVSNATHTGDVTGSTALTISPTAISGKTLVTAVGADHLLILDATDGTLKKALASDLVGGGGATNLSYTAATRVVASDTGTDATLPLVTTGDAGLAPASGGGTTNFLRADGTWAAPAGGGGGGASPIISWMI